MHQKLKMIFTWITGAKFERNKLVDSQICSVTASQRLLEFKADKNPNRLLRILDLEKDDLNYCFAEEVVTIILDLCAKIKSKTPQDKDPKYRHKCVVCEKTFKKRAWQCKRCLFWTHLECAKKITSLINNEYFNFCAECYNSE